MVDFLIKYFFRQAKDIVVPLGTTTQEDSIFAVVYTKNLWLSEPAINKILSIITFRWKPKDSTIRLFAQDTLMNELFGSENDFGIELFNLICWHQSREWKPDKLTPDDIRKVDGMRSMTVLSQTRLREKLIIPLNLNMYDRAPQMCLLLYPMMTKIPVISIQNFLSLHTSFAFQSIRNSDHPFSNDIIQYLYEILYQQQKIAVSLHEYARRIIYTEQHKKQAVLVNAEINAIMGADLVFAYLKSSIEKTIVLIGLTHEIKNLDSKKTHKARIKHLEENLPEKALKTHYCIFILEFIKSENLEELNSYRTGLLHKRGISDLQPHNYSGQNALELPLRKIFQILHEQHSKNTAILIGALALLCDDLMNRDPPTDLKSLIEKMPMPNQTTLSKKIKQITSAKNR